MNRRTFLGLPALALVLGACGTADSTSQPTTAPAAPAPTAASAATIAVTEVWSRPALGPDDPTPTGSAMAAKPTGAAMKGSMEGPTGAVFMTISNTGSSPDRLIKAKSGVADVTEIHNVFDNNGVKEMRPVDGVDIPAGGTVQLKPGGFHVMLIGLHQALALGDSFEVALEFQQAGTITVKSTVRQPQ